MTLLEFTAVFLAGAAFPWLMGRAADLLAGKAPDADAAEDPTPPQVTYSEECAAFRERVAALGVPGQFVGQGTWQGDRQGGLKVRVGLEFYPGTVLLKWAIRGPRGLAEGTSGEPARVAEIILKAPTIYAERFAWKVRTGPTNEARTEA